MARDIIKIQMPVIEMSDSAGIKTIVPQTVTVANGIKLSNAMECVNNTLFLVINNTYSGADCTITINKGDKFPNTMLGNLILTVTKSAMTIVQIQDPARFVNSEGAIAIDFSASFAGTIFAIGKKAGF